MAKRPFAIDITANDKTQAGIRSAERRFEGMRKPLDRLSRQTDRWGRGTAISGFTRGLTGLAGAGSSAAGGLAQAVQGTVGLGSAAAATGWALGGLTGAVVVAAAAGTRMGINWARTSTETLRAARGIGMATEEYQKFQIAGKLAGASPEAMATAMASVGDVFQDAAFGRNPEAQAMLMQLGIRLKRTKDGAIDVKAALLDIAGALEGRNPQVQRRIAQVLGVEGALPLLRRGRVQVQKDLNEAMATGAVVLDKNAKAAEELTRQVEKLDLKWQGLKKTMTAQWVIPWLKPMIDGAGRDGGLIDMITGMVAGDEKAKRAFRQKFPWLTGGNRPRVSDRPGGDFGAFAERVEKQESGGRQLRIDGLPLRSSAGAVGVMQMLPETAEATARKHKIPWDRRRFHYDIDYNRRLGRLHLWDLRQKYGGSEVLAAAAYNAGERRLDGMWTKDRYGKRVWRPGWLERFGDPRKGEISEADFAARIPFEETRDYVAATAGVGGIGRDGKATVDINLRGAPAGTTVQSSSDRRTQANVKVERAMAGDD